MKRYFVNIYVGINLIYFLLFIYISYISYYVYNKDNCWKFIISFVLVYWFNVEINMFFKYYF